MSERRVLAPLIPAPVVIENSTVSNCKIADLRCLAESPFPPEPSWYAGCSCMGRADAATANRRRRQHETKTAADRLQPVTSFSSREKRQCVFATTRASRSSNCSSSWPSSASSRRSRFPACSAPVMSGNEASAIGSLRAINSSQPAFSSSCANGFYAPTLTDLAMPPAGGTPFISPDLGAADARWTKSGYDVTMAVRRDGVAAGDGIGACNGVAAADLTSSWLRLRNPTLGGFDRHALLLGWHARHHLRRHRGHRLDPSAWTPPPAARRFSNGVPRSERQDAGAVSSRGPRPWPVRQPRATRLPAYNSHHVALVSRIRCARAWSPPRRRRGSTTGCSTTRPTSASVTSMRCSVAATPIPASTERCRACRWRCSGCCSSCS